MKIFLNFVQILSALITVSSAYGAWIDVGDYFTKLGFETDTLEVVFFVSLLLTIISYFGRSKLTKPEIGRDKKSQVQIFGRGNRQNMK